MSKKLKEGKKHVFFIPFAYYRRKIKHYVGSDVRIYKSFIEFIDKNVRDQNKELISKLLEFKKMKTLTKSDLVLFLDIVRIYRPRRDLEILEKVNYRQRIKKMIEDKGIRATKDAWFFFSNLLHQIVDHLARVLEKYLLDSGRKTLHCNDITSIFEDNSYFLI
jgi:histone H3/H4